MSDDDLAWFSSWIAEQSKRISDTTTSTFGFRVEHWAPGEYDIDSPDGWRVTLPHQCEAWDIAGEKYETPPPHARAVADLERFIAEAMMALEALKARRADA